MKVKKEMEVLSRAIERAVLTPQEKVAVGKSLQRLALIMAGYSDAGDKGVIGGYNGTFPLSTATEGNIYLEPKTGKYYRCKTNYNGTQITGPNSNFVDLSVAANADRLNNLESISTFLITNTGFGNFNFIKIGTIKILSITINQDLINIEIKTEEKTIPISIPEIFFPKIVVSELLFSTFTLQPINFVLNNNYFALRSFSGNTISKKDFNGNTLQYTIIYY